MTLDARPDVLYGIPTMVGTTLMFREVASGELRDLVHIFRTRYLEHHVRIIITDYDALPVVAGVPT